MCMDKSTAITSDSIKLPAEGGSPLTLTEIGSVLAIPTTSTFNIIFASMDGTIPEYEKKHSKTIQPAGSRKSLSPAFVLPLDN